MIFVILGIAVLVASFLIALVSLVKEQNKVQDTDDASTKPKSPSIADGGAKVGPVPAAAPSPKPTIDEPKPVVNRELFPWEEGRYKTASSEVEADRAKVEVLRSQLAELKSRAVAENAGQIPQEVQQASQQEDQPRFEEPQAPVAPEPQPKAEIPTQRLSGEVSIADLKGS